MPRLQTVVVDFPKRHFLVRFTYTRYPAIQGIPLSFPLNDKFPDWKSFYVCRLQREEKIRTSFKSAALEFFETGSASDFAELVNRFESIKSQSELAGFFPNYETHPELSVLADLIFYDQVDIKHERDPCESQYDEWNITGCIIGLDGKAHDFSYVHMIRYHRQDQETLTEPTLTVGKLRVELSDTEKVVSFVEKLEKLLQLKDVSAYELWLFVSSYMKPEQSYEEIDSEMRRKFKPPKKSKKKEYF